MRGIFLQHPLEFRLEVLGDSFTQGSGVSCTLTIKNHGQAAMTLSDLTLRLALANLKKVKAKDDTAFEPIESAEIERGIEIPAQGDLSIPYGFSLSPNCPITDKQQSPYLLYGNSPSNSALGQLLLTVQVHPYIRTIFDTFTTAFNFVHKGESSKSGWTSVKLKPPESRRMSFVEELNLSTRFVDGSIELTYLFTVKKFDHSMVTVDVKRGKTAVKQTWDSSDYLFGGGFIRQEYVERMIDAALAEVSSGL